MPIGSLHTTPDAVYRQLLSDDALCWVAPQHCGTCWELVGFNPEPRIFDEVEDIQMPVNVTWQTPVEGSIMPTEKKSKPKVYVHVEPRVPNAVVHDPRATCGSCDEHATDSHPLAYCYNSIEELALYCSVCRSEYLTFCSTEAVYSANSYRVTGANGRYTQRYCYEHFYYDAENNHWYASYAMFVDESRRRLAANPTYGYHETNPITRHGWPEETAPHELCFGVELEMERKGREMTTGCAEMSEALGGRDGTLQHLRDANMLSGRYILARDGSLNSTGVELITSPYTLEFHQNKFGWPALLETVKGIGMSGKGTDRCGMHVHCNRQAISALTLGKMLVFANSAENKALIERIAQRDSSFARKVVKKIVDGKRITSEKYDCLHITQNTIECRLFRGNLRPERVLKNIEFCHAMITYCSTASIAACHTYTDFIAWLGKNRGAYKNLVKFLAPHYGYKLSRADVIDDL